VSATGCDGCDGQVRTSEGSEAQQFCGFQPVQVRRVGANFGATGCDARFAPVAVRNARDSAAFGGSSANLSATGATGRFAPFRAQKSRNPAGFRLPVRRVVRTANPDFRAVASEVSRGAPPYQYSPRKDPEFLNRSLPMLPRSVGGSACRSLINTYIIWPSLPLYRIIT
jgi:hypothetical protein